MPIAKPETSSALSEGVIVFLVACIQFVVIIDFVMVMPLGPDFAKALNFDMAHLGWIGGSYTLAGALAGLCASGFLDRFDRRQALLVALSGLGVFTFLCGLAWSFESMVLLRVLTGLFGGPCTALSYAVVGDVVPDKRRGAAMGKLMLSFSVASVFGIPFGLELARVSGWQAPFFVAAVLAVLVGIGAWRFLPSLRDHIRPHTDGLRYFQRQWRLLSHPLHLQSFGCVALGMVAAFLIIPNLATYVQFNLGLPREDLGTLYIVGGLVSFCIVTAVGKLVDHTWPSVVGALGALFLMVVMLGGFLMPAYQFSPMIIYTLFMMGMSMRNISTNTLVAKVPSPHERAGFMALISCTSQSFAAVGAFLSSMMLSDGEANALVGMDHVALLALVLSILVPLQMWWVERHLKKRALAAHAPPIAVELQ